MKKTNKPPSYWNAIRRAAVFREGLVQRVKLAREGSGKSTKQVASELGVSLSRYRMWESRSQIRMQFAEAFCDITGTDVEWLLTEHRPHLRADH